MIQGRYTRVAIALHWGIALALTGMVISGLVMTGDVLPKSVTFQLYQVHKASGLVLLMLVAFRLIWRVMHPAPALPDVIPVHEKRLALLGHAGLYALMIAIPLAGWVIVSASVYGLPTSMFGLFSWPHLPGIAGNPVIEQRASTIHEYLAYALIALVAIHILAVIKHAVKDRVHLLRRMGVGMLGGLLVGSLCLLPLSAGAAIYRVDPAHSAITFTGEHAGTEFSGRFNAWEAMIDFDPDAPEKTTLTVTIDLASAHTGNAQYDDTLPTKDWFDVASFPKAMFVATSFVPKGDHVFNVTGDLTLRGVTKPLSFDARLDDPAGAPVTATGSFTLSRLAYGIGTGSDGTAEWVADPIRIDFTLVAAPPAPVP